MKKILLLTMVVFGVSSCNQSPQTINQQGESVKQVDISTDAPFEMQLPINSSPIRGITVKSDTYFTLDNMELDLLDLSATKISTDYYYQQGEILTAKDATNLLSHKLSEEAFQELLKTDPEAKNVGLNPQITDDPNTNLNYVTTLLEQDFYQQSGDQKTIKAIGVGVGVDLAPHTTDSDFKPDMNKFLEHDGKIIANQIAEVVRSREGYDKLPIFFGFYQQSTNPVVPGAFIASGYLDTNDENVQKLVEVNQEYVPFLDEAGIAKDLDVNNKVQTLKNDLNAYFGNNVNLSCVGFYNNNKLTKININVIFPTVSKIEGNAIINFIEKELKGSVNLNAYTTVEVVSSSGEAIASLTKNGSTINKVVNKG